MRFDDDEFAGDTSDTTKIGSDELLSDDNLRLPESANTLVRLHAVRAWLTRRQVEMNIEIGEAALTLQQAFQEPAQETRLHRRTRERDSMQRVQQAQQALEEAQQGLAAYEEAQELLEDTVSHTTSSERTLVEYYLALEELVQESLEEHDPTSPRMQALADVQHRIEHVGTPSEEE